MSRMDDVGNMSQRDIDAIFWDKMNDELNRGSFTICGASEIRRHQLDNEPPSILRTTVTTLGSGALALCSAAFAMKGMQEMVEFYEDVFRSFTYLRR